MEKSIIIAGAGMGGLAAGVYGRLNGYRTTILEQHSLPGGQCCSWKRRGYTFDGCIHHLFGTDPSSKLFTLWKELGAMPRELARTRECVSVASTDGKLFNDLYDTDRLAAHLKELSPADSGIIDGYVGAITRFARVDFSGEAMMGSKAGLARMLPSMLPLLKWFKPTMEQFAQRFSNEFLRRAFPLLEYSIRDIPFFLHLAKHAYGRNGAIAWPVGASLAFARSIEKRYLDLGGEVHYRQKVAKVLTEGGRAVGVRLEDGSEHRADIVISNADGRRTIMDLLDGRYLDEKLKRYCEPPVDETSWAVHVFLGVARDLAAEPSALVLLLDKPATIANHTTDSIEMQMYGFDPTMAPEGKGVIKVELVSQYSYWKRLYEDRARYDEEKQKVAEQVIDLLESAYFTGLRSQVEQVDVPTLMTWERYVGGTHGFLSGPAKEFNPNDIMFGKGYSTLPGLSNFFMVGTWATSTGALFANALSGRKVVRALCKADGKKFVTG